MVFFGLLQVVGRRLWNNLAMMLTIAAGFVVAIALVVCIPVYAEAVGYKILRNELTVTANGQKRPPFAFMYRYLGSQKGAISFDTYAKLDSFMAGTVDQRLGLTVADRVRYVASDKMPMLQSSGVGNPLLYVTMAFASGLDQHITLIDGALPKVAAADGPVEVLIGDRMAANLGLQVGEEYMVLAPKDQATGFYLRVKIAGVWRATNPDEDWWFYQPDTLNETLFMPEQSYRERVVLRNPKPVYVALWYLLADGSKIRSSDVPSVVARIGRTGNDIGSILAGTRTDIAPTEALQRHQQQVQRLTLILTVFSIPVLGLIAYFISLVAGLVVQRQSNEIAVLRSRGTSRAQVLGIYLIEWLLLGGIALGFGLYLGQFAGLLMTWTRSFLDLVVGERLPIELTPDAWSRALQTLVLLIVAGLIPAFGAAGFTIVSFKSERARGFRKPWWQRFYLDILLLIPVYYGYTQLSQRGSISFLGFGGGGSDPFNNPLLLLAPSLAIFTLALVATRLFPLLMTALAWLTSRLPGVATVTALRYLARTPSAYSGPVLLLILTLSLATFTASMARTLDVHLVDQVYYTNGGDVRLFDLGQSTQASSAGTPGTAQTSAAPTTPELSDVLTEPRFLFLPVTDYLRVPGVTHATRVATSPADLISGGKTIEGRFVGVDRADITEVARWRVDYGSESLGALMNRLADDPSMVLVDSRYAAQTGLRAGDRFTIAMNDLDVRREIPVTVAGYINMFPTIYPADGPFVVGNLDYAFEQQGGQYPYNVWLTVTPGTPYKDIYAGLVENNLKTFDQGFSPTEIAAEHDRPERQGFYGLLSVGFIASAFLTVLGFLFYSILSFQRRFVELGMLRAIGLSTMQLGTLLAWEQSLIIGTGLLAGTAIGVGCSQLFIPYLQVRRGTNDGVPPFLVQIAWDQITIIYIVFMAMLVLAVLGMGLLLRRMKLFQAVKLGEAI